MSSYTWYTGKIRFKDKKTFDMAVKIGHESGCLSVDRDNYAPEGEEDEVAVNNTLQLPHAVCANDGAKGIHHLIQRYCQIGFKGNLVGTCTDGETSGWKIKDGIVVEKVDIIEWAIANIEAYKGESKEGIDGLENDDAEEYNEVIADIVACYHESFED